MILTASLCQVDMFFVSVTFIADYTIRYGGFSSLNVIWLSIIAYIHFICGLICNLSYLSLSIYENQKLISRGSRKMTKRPTSPQTTKMKSKDTSPITISSQLNWVASFTHVACVMLHMVSKIRRYFKKENVKIDEMRTGWSLNIAVDICDTD